MKEVIEPVEAVKETKPAEAVPVKETEKKAEVVEEKTIGEQLNKQDNVPLSTFLEIKNESKAAKQEINDLKKQIEEGASKQDISKGIKEIANEHNVDENFLNEFANTVKAQAEKEIDAKIAEKLKPLQDEDNAKKVDNIFNENYDRVLENMPEFKNVANKAVIKTLALDPANKNKTFTKIIEEAYGHLIKGKKTIESSTPNSKSEGETLDKAKLKDPVYMKKVLADPDLKKEYNEGLVERLGL
jgi:hypothetical protein